MLTLINQARTSAGLPPLAVNPQLTASAQGHANDMLQKGIGIGHLGSDGSTPAMRIVRAGYHPYSWGPFIGENWAAYQTVDISMGFWMSDAPHRDNILRPGFREIGIGVVYLPEGYPILVTDFGAQPNVLPIWVSGSGATVSVTLSNEDAVPAGDGPNVIGQAVQVDLSAYADLTQAQTFPFTRSIVFTAPGGRAVSMLYARFRDAQGRTVLSAASPSGQLIAPAAPVTSTPLMRPSATPTRTTSPRATSTPRPSSTRTPLPSATRTITPSPTSAATSLPTATDTEIAPTEVATALPPVVSVNDQANPPLMTPGQSVLTLAAVCVLIVLLVACWQIWKNIGML
ncbi:MAG: CAP domain-containing protein [Anaerolineae bacterium]